MNDHLFALQGVTIGPRLKQVRASGAAVDVFEELVLLGGMHGIGGRILRDAIVHRLVEQMRMLVQASVAKLAQLLSYLPSSRH